MSAAGDAERERLRNEAIQEGLPLARRLARRYRGRGEPLDDLYQVAALALVTAVDRYEPSRGSFEGYAALYIVGALKRHFRDHGWAIRVPRRHQELVREVNTAIGHLSQLLGHTPSIAEIAGHLAVSRTEVLQALDAAGCYHLKPLDAPMAVGHGEVVDAIGRSDPGYGEVNNRLIALSLVKTLPRQQQVILGLRFFGNMPQSQIGAELGISQMQVSRLLSKALRRLARHATA